MRIFLFSLALLCTLTAYAQQHSRLDSLLKASKTDKGRALVHSYNEISWEYKNSNIDSSLVYGKKALSVAKSIEDQQAIASAYNSIASSFEALSQLDSSLTYHFKSLEIKKIINDTLGIANTLNNLGIIYDTKGNYSKALECYFDALRIYEVHADEFNKVPMVYVNIGIVYKKQKAYDKVLEYYKKALEIYKDNNYVIGEAITNGNVGSVLLNLEKYKESISYSQRAEKMYDSLGYSRYVPYMRVNIAIAKDSLKIYTEAKKDYLEAINAFENDNNLYELSNAKVSLAYNYIVNKNYVNAKMQLRDAIKIATENSFKEIEIKALKQLADVDALTGDYKNAYAYLNRYAVQKDSVFETEKTKTVFELETKYETEKKEKEILSQRADIAEKELDISKKNSYILGLGALTIVLGLLGYLIYNQQKLKNRQLKKQNELKDALLKIETQNKLQDQRLRISRDLHDNIGAQLTFIISSIDNLKYAFEIKNKKLKDKLSTISDFTSITIYELRDTIWAMNKSKISFEDLQTRISNYIDKAHLYDSNIKFSFNVDDTVDTSKKFTSVEGMNIHRVIQEAIHNSLKYAEATMIKVEIKEVNSNLLFKISDNGIGFDLALVKRGNGLHNMEKRIKNIGGDVQIYSKENKGTEIIITI
jgi:signal transduction histidine kinase